MCAHHNDPAGVNNPNIPGQNNGYNAWMDMQLNNEEIEHDEAILTGYAKHNADTSAFCDIDDVPMRGPPTEAHQKIHDTARKLINDKHVPIYRKTGSRVR